MANDPQPTTAKNEQVQAALACHRDVPDCKPTAKQDCKDVVNISIFFDGTGNNKEADEKDQKWSNVARIWLSAFNQLTYGNLQ